MEIEAYLRLVKRFVRLLLAATLLLIVGLPLYAVPATLSLPRGRRPGLEKLTITQVA